ncbi:NUDIX hydrolase [Chitinivorax sp. B]|uniref:NUDIX hydrolase n=1 Tax=Chitinivorax sp. B TaxID=2502235 RepID=UPI0010F9CC73|nr:NUDIX hydrolase [Chitinivorax sp. B]
MNQTIWKPNVTVAAVIERNGRFLLVEEETPEGIRFNQPAGHLDEGESILSACSRETREETAWRFTPKALVGIYLIPVLNRDITYLRFAFCGELGEHDAARKLDDGILRAVWMTPEEIRVTADRHRSPLVLRCMEDFLIGKRYPLNILTELLPS